MCRKFSLLLGLTIGVLAFCTDAESQGTSKPAPKAPPPASDNVENDDILILVNLTAKEVRFDAVPDPKVEFPGKPERATLWVTDRFNLPDKVEPGVTYRNIGINLRISSRFADIEQIVREALGEARTSEAVKTDTPAVTAGRLNSASKRPRRQLRK